MRPLLIAYLAAYYLLVGAAVITLWTSGVIEHLPRGWTILAISGALLLGAALAVLSRGRAPTTQSSEDVLPGGQPGGTDVGNRRL